jgi:hypothetical protein
MKTQETTLVMQEMVEMVKMVEMEEKLQLVVVMVEMEEMEEKEFQLEVVMKTLQWHVSVTIFYEYIHVQSDSGYFCRLLSISN